MTAWTTARLSAGTGHDDPLLAVRRLDDEVGPDRQLAPGRGVLAVDEQHHPDQDRDEDHDEVGAVDELDRHDDDEDDRGQDRAEAR